MGKILCCIFPVVTVCMVREKDDDYDENGNYNPKPGGDSSGGRQAGPPKKPHKGDLYKLEKFDFKTMKPISNFLVIGKRNCGKTNFLKGLLYYLCHGGRTGIGKIAVLSGTEEENPQYQKEFGIPVEFIRPDANGMFVEHLIQMQSKITCEIRQDDDFDNNEHALVIILDDLVYDKQFMKNKNLIKMMFNGRHRKVAILILSQDAIGTMCAARSSFDYVIIFRCPAVRDATHCYRTFFPMFPTFHDFHRTMVYHTTNYGFMISDNTIMADTVEKQYYRGRFPNMSNKRVKLILNYSDTRPFLQYLAEDRTTHSATL